MWRNLHLPKGHWHFPSFQEWQNGVRRRESRLPEEDWGNPEREDDQGSSEEDVGECRWKLSRSKFILDQSLRPEAAASLLKARSYSRQARPGCWRAVWIMRSLYFVRSKWSISLSKLFYFRLLYFWVCNMELHQPHHPHPRSCILRVPPWGLALPISLVLNISKKWEWLQCYLFYMKIQPWLHN